MNGSKPDTRELFRRISRLSNEAESEWTLNETCEVLSEAGVRPDDLADHVLQLVTRLKKESPLHWRARAHTISLTKYGEVIRGLRARKERLAQQGGYRRDSPAPQPVEVTAEPEPVKSSTLDEPAGDLFSDTEPKPAKKVWQCGAGLQLKIEETFRALHESGFSQDGLVEKATQICGNEKWWEYDAKQASDFLVAIKNTLTMRQGKTKGRR